MQRGTIIKHRSSWTLIYYEVQYRNGQPKRVRVSKKLATISKDYPTAASVRQLADDILAPLNKRQHTPESSVTLSEFIEHTYFPVVEHKLRPSTVAGYKTSIYFPHLKARLEKSGIRLRDFRTVDAQRLLRSIDGVGHTTLKHIKNFLSGVFKFARQEGVLNSENPIRDVEIPGRPTKFRGVAYSIEDAEAMVETIEEAQSLASESAQELYATAIDVIVLLSLTGLRQSEARGIRWSDWDEKQELLSVSRGVWQTYLNGTKNPASENTIPVLPLLAELLRSRHERLAEHPNPRFHPTPDDYIFAGERRKTPLNFHNLEYKIIKPALEKSAVKWKGFHGFRRGLATNLLEVGVNPVVAARILRHGDVSTTLAFYARARDAESRDAMRKLEEKIRNRPSGVLIGGERL